MQRKRHIDEAYDCISFPETHKRMLELYDADKDLQATFTLTHKDAKVTLSRKLKWTYYINGEIYNDKNNPQPAAKLISLILNKTPLVHEQKTNEIQTENDEYEEIDICISGSTEKVRMKKLFDDKTRLLNGIELSSIGPTFNLPIHVLLQRIRDRFNFLQVFSAHEKFIFIIGYDFNKDKFNEQIIKKLKEVFITSNYEDGKHLKLKTANTMSILPKVFNNFLLGKTVNDESLSAVKFSRTNKTERLEIVSRSAVKETKRGGGETIREESIEVQNKKGSKEKIKFEKTYYKNNVEQDELVGLKIILPENPQVLERRDYIRLKLLQLQIFNVICSTKQNTSSIVVFPRKNFKAIFELNAINIENVLLGKEANIELDPKKTAATHNQQNISETTTTVIIPPENIIEVEVTVVPPSTPSDSPPSMSTQQNISATTTTVIANTESIREVEVTVWSAPTSNDAVLFKAPLPLDQFPYKRKLNQSTDGQGDSNRRNKQARM